MDVTATPLGRTPKFSHYVPPPVAAGGGRGGGAADAHAADPPEIAGVPDGPDLLLPSGVRIRKKRIADRVVGNLQVEQAVRAVQLLPLADQQLLARLGIPVELVPVTQLERLASATAPVVGATLITSLAGTSRAERLRIAAYQSQVGTSLAEAIQHEIGHVVAVTTRQDTSEDAAIRYAATY